MRLLPIYDWRVVGLPATRRQALTEQNLHELGRELLRQLCQLLVVERRLRVDRVQPRAESDDIYTNAQVLWRPRPSVVRLVHRTLRPTDVEDFARVARDVPLAEAVLVEGAQGDAAVETDSAVEVVRAAELAARIRASALIEWTGGQPQPARGRLKLARDLTEVAVALDPIGLRWLPTLALNQVPSGLEDKGRADELFERVAFRILTTSLRFSGRRLGARSRAERAPDAVLRWGRSAALLDCKAAQYGYRMDIDDQRALVEYFGAVKSEEASDGFELTHIVVLSSGFDGEAGDRHPFHGRAAAVREECGAALAYLRATDVVRLAVAIEGDEPDPSDREAVRWEELFQHGMPTPEQVAEMWPVGGE